MRWFTVLVVTAMIAASCSVSSSQGPNAPDILEHFHLLPRQSTLSISGGIAGIDQSYPVRGEFDLIRFFREGARHARFDNADILSPILSGFPAYIDVDELLSFEELQGDILPLGAPFEVIEFNGETFDGQRFRMFTANVGPWLFLQGESIPPARSNDFFKYEIQGLARTSPWEDMNGDGVVDAADYTLIRDGDDSPARLDQWKEQYGQITPEVEELQLMFSSAVATASAIAIPEASGIMLLMLGLFPATMNRRTKD